MQQINYTKENQDNLPLLLKFYLLFLRIRLQLQSVILNTENIYVEARLEVPAYESMQVYEWIRKAFKKCNLTQLHTPFCKLFDLLIMNSIELDEKFYCCIVFLK